MTVVAKKKRVSKRNKISWRKHVNITDVEDFLEDTRLEERVVPHLTTISNEKLFHIDVKPSEKLLSAKERKQLFRDRPLRCFSMLQSHSKVPDPIAKRNRVRTKEERRNALLIKKEDDNRARGVLKAKQIQSKKDQKLCEYKKASKPRRDVFDTDIWGKDECFPIDSDEWATNNTKRHNLRGVGKLHKNVTRSIKEKKTVLPPVEAPHPGMSYNPSYEDHQDLLKQIADKEVKVIKQEEHLARVTRGMFSKVTEDKRDASWLSEMSEGLQQKSTVGAATEPASDNDDDDEYKALNPPVKNSKKTLKQKRKQKEQRQLLLKKVLTKREKKKITDLHLLKVLKEKLANRAQKLTVQNERRKLAKEVHERKTKRLSALKFEESELDFNMCQDLAGNLRNLKSEGDLLRDRFNSFQKRNIVEPTIRRNHKSARVKRVVKPGHKQDIWIKTVARQSIK